jgi:hypothetical protein
LHHFFAPLMFEIDVDIGRFLALLGDEAFEQHVHARRIDFGDAQAVTPPNWLPSRVLAEDVATAGEAHDVRR